MSEVKIKKPKPVLELSGQDGNAYIIGRACRALREHGYTREEVAEYEKDAMSGNYDHVLQVTMKWCEVE